MNKGADSNRAVYFLQKVFMITVINILVLFSYNELIDKEEILKKKIVLISHVYSNPYWQEIKRGADKAAEEKGVIVEYQGPNYANSKEGIKLINMASAANVSGIITYIQNDSEYNGEINKVIEKGIPIITIDTDAEKSKRLAYIGSDNYNAGEVAGQKIVEAIGKNGSIGVILGGDGVKNQSERFQGFQDYLSRNSNIKIDSIQSSDSYLVEAELAAKKILLRNSDINAIFCESAQDGIGAARAIESMNLKGKVKIVCFDDLKDTLEYIKKGTIFATVAQREYEMGYEAVNMIIDIINGKEINSLNLLPVYVIDNNNVDSYLRGLNEKK